MQKKELDLNFYIVIQTCKGYEKALENLLSQLHENKIYKNIIVVEGKNEKDEIVKLDQITFIKTTKNNFDLTMFGKIYELIDQFTEHDLFLFLHDTIELTGDFYFKINKLNEIIKNHSLDFDFFPLAENFQSAQGFATRNFIKDKFKPFLDIEYISKDEAIEWEWGYGKYEKISIRNMCKTVGSLVSNQTNILELESYFLNTKHPRAKCYYESLGIIKYYFLHSIGCPHPNEL